MSAVAGLLSSTSAQTNDLVGEFQESIFVRNAKGMNVGSTLFGLMAKLKSEPADNIEYNWFERDPVMRTVYTNNGAGYSATATTFVFDDGSGNFAMLAGEPLLAGNDAPDRSEDLRTISSEIEQRQYHALANSRGTFAVADHRGHTLTVATDRIGVRPVYYWSNEDIFVFSSVLRVLESMPCGQRSDSRDPLSR